MFRSHSAHGAQERIRDEIRQINQALDELRHSAQGPRYHALKDRAERLWEDAGGHLADGYDELRRYGLHARDCARQHPMLTLSLGIGVCLVVGWLVCRRR